MATESLYPFQKEGVSFLTKRKHALLADDMGLGKTVQAIIASIEVLANKILIICPASVKLNWKKELVYWGSLDTSNYFQKDNIYIVNGRKAIIPNKKVVIINYDLVIYPEIQKQLRREWHVVICDEAHYLKSRSSKRTHAVLGKTGIIRNSYFKWLLTGTPVLNRPIELYPVIQTLAGTLIEPHNTYTKFSTYFCAGYYDGFAWNDRGASNVDELANRIKPFYLRRLKKEVLSELPDKIFKTIFLPITPAINRVLDLEQDLEASEEGGNLGQLASIRRLTAEAKLPEVIQYAHDVLNNGCRKLVIFAHHKVIVQKLQQEFSSSVVLVGGMTANAKQEALEKFINSDIQLFIGNIKAAGTGIDGLQKVCSHVMFAEVSWSPGEMDQAVDRLHRIGQNSKGVQVDFLVAEGTIEEVMVRTLIKKTKLIRRLGV